MSPDVLAMNREKLKAAGVNVELTDPPNPEKLAKAHDKAEKDLQAKVEQWLYHRGYYRRSPEGFSAVTVPPKGWQVHIHKAKRNPILLDLLILGNDGRFLELELKVKGGKVSQEQKTILAGRNQRLAWNFEEAIQAVMGWENGSIL